MNGPTGDSRTLAEVAAHDAAGRHDAAINVLAQATAGGDFAAMAALGSRLLVGDRAPLLAAEGARFLLDAAGAGQATALERVAALTAGGIHFRQNWSEALRLLGQAAGKGSQAAASQLTVLAGQRADSADWEQLSSRIDLAAWLQVPAGEVVGGVPEIRRFPELLPGSACDWLIQTARGRLKRARVYDPAQGKDTTSQTRSNSAATFNLADVGVLHFVMQAKMSAASGHPTSHMEGPAILHYAVGEQIGNHYDFIDPLLPNYREHLARQGQRVATFLLYLNDDYEGGATDFPEFGVRQAGVRGTGLCFINAHADGEPDTRMLHAGLPPTRGEKWIVSQFIRSRPLPV